MSSIQRAALLLISILSITGCASSRVYNVEGEKIQPQEAAVFYLVVPELTETVTYNMLGNPFNYDKRAPGRKKIDARPDVPDQVSKYLSELGHEVVLGPALAQGSDSEFTVTYEELWGWDLRSIIKMLEIEICETDSGECSSCSFEEMTFFNSQPTARSVVPRMLDELILAPSASP